MGQNYRRYAPLVTSGTFDTTNAMAISTAYTQAWVLSGVYLFFNAQITETFTVTFKSGNGSAYYCVFKSESLTTATSASYLPGALLLLDAGDNVTVGLTSASATATCGYTIIGYEV